jgi:putative ABC transport system permease protein
MNLLTIAWKSIRQRLLASTLTGVCVALGVALMVAVLIVNGIVTKMFSQTGTGYYLLIGPKGSELQLVLSTIYRLEDPIENLPWDYYEELKSDPRVEVAIPVAFGDFTELGAFPIIGTMPQYFSLDVVRGQKFMVRGDYLQGTWDAVIGSEVARKNNWDIGSQFRMIHAGRDAGPDAHIHEELFTVRGVLQKTGTPNDRSVFVHLDGFFLLDEHEKPIGEAIQREARFWRVSEEEIRTRYRSDLDRLAREAAHEEHGAEEPGHEGHHHHAHFISNLQKEVTSILVVTACDPSRKLDCNLQRSANALSLKAELKEGFQSQAVTPVEPMKKLLDNFVGNVQQALLYLTGLVIAVSGVSIFVSIYNSMADRRREIGIMRALGARRQSVLAIIILESLLLCVGGGLVGLALGHAVVFVAAPIVEARTGGLLIDPLAFEPIELVVIPVTLVMGTLIGFLPGLTAYRTDVAEALSR